MARPKREVIVTTEQYISDLAEKQCSKVEIASRLGISVDTLDRRYAEHYDKGRQLGRSKLREKIYSSALSGNVTLLIFCAKNWLGMSDKQSLELSGPEGGPIATQDLSKLTTDELHALRAMAAKLAPESAGDQRGTREASTAADQRPAAA